MRQARVMVSYSSQGIDHYPVPILLHFVAASLVNFYTVQSSEKLDIPKSLIIPSCNLELGRTIGQGNNTIGSVLCYQFKM